MFNKLINKVRVYAFHFWNFQMRGIKPTRYRKNIEVNKKSVEVTCSKVSSIVILGNGSASNVCHGKEITSAKISLEPFFNSKWVRIVIIDKDQKRAWSNPIWLKE